MKPHLFLVPFFGSRIDAYVYQQSVAGPGQRFF